MVESGALAAGAAALGAGCRGSTKKFNRVCFAEIVYPVFMGMQERYTMLFVLNAGLSALDKELVLGEDVHISAVDWFYHLEDGVREEYSGFKQDLPEWAEDQLEEREIPGHWETTVKGFIFARDRDQLNKLIESHPQLKITCGKEVAMGKKATNDEGDLIDMVDDWMEVAYYCNLSEEALFDPECLVERDETQ
jgi:hypothetical protein